MSDLEADEVDIVVKLTVKCIYEGEKTLEEKILEIIEKINM